MRTLTLLALLLTPVAHAAGASVSVSLRLTVQAVCEVQSRTPEQLTLRCTRNFTPADPHALPELAGQLPLAPLHLTGSAPAPSGGTLNTYAVQDAATPSGELVFY